MRLPGAHSSAGVPVEPEDETMRAQLQSVRISVIIGQSSGVAVFPVRGRFNVPPEVHQW